jgi:3alpha(or 20beta)-hydroxysteroid dehydrogenase
MGGRQVGRLSGKVAIVTGAARGQGEAEARLFAAEGADVVATDVLTDALQAVVADLGGAAIGLTHDVTRPEEWTAVVDAAVEAFGGVDVLVNNAGIHWIRLLVDEDPAELERLLRVNLVGPYLGMQAVVPAMTERGAGSIVNISSVAGLQGAWGHSAYGASKWGLRGLTKTAAIELGQHGIRVNSVHPGPIDTAMLPVPPDAPMFDSQAINRAGTVDEVAAAVLFLASDESRYVTGAEIAVDGGLVAGPLPKMGRPPKEA